MTTLALDFMWAPRRLIDPDQYRSTRGKDNGERRENHSRLPRPRQHREQDRLSAVKRQRGGAPRSCSGLDQFAPMQSGPWCTQQMLDEQLGLVLHSSRRPYGCGNWWLDMAFKGANDTSDLPRLA